MGLEDGEDEVEREQLGTHCLRAQVSFTLRTQWLHAQLAERSQDEKSILDKQLSLAHARLLHQTRRRVALRCPFKGGSVLKRTQGDSLDGYVSRLVCLVAVPVCFRPCFPRYSWPAFVATFTVVQWHLFFGIPGGISLPFCLVLPFVCLVIASRENTVGLPLRWRAQQVVTQTGLCSLRLSPWHSAEDVVDHLREDSLGDGLRWCAFGHEKDVVHCPDRLEETRLVHMNRRRQDHGQERLDDLQLRPVVEPVVERVAHG